jgi:hypothetical protein
VTIAVVALFAQVKFFSSPEAKFWKWFKANDAALFAVRTTEEPICDVLANELHKLHPKLTFE